MSEFRFIHCSDLHLDSSFSGLATAKPELRKILQNSTFQSFNNIVTLALNKKVDAVLIAGDVYDSAAKSLRAQLAFRNGLAKLSDEGIPSFVVHGNHDPLDSWSASLDWPDLVTVFAGDRVESFPITRNGKRLATVYGISYPQRDVNENLALGFKRKREDGFAIGILHANVGGDKNHENYAPCHLEDLIAAKMDYWALGHVHTHKTLRENDPAIIYCGNSQGRSFREIGPKGCCFTTLRHNHPPKIEFKETSAIRFDVIVADVSENATLDELVRQIVKKCETASLKAGKNKSIVRVHLKGRTILHNELKRDDTLETLSDEIGRHLEELGIWIDFKLETGNVYDIDSLSKANDFLADMIHLYNEAEQPENLEEIRAILKPVFDNWQGGRFIEEPTSDDLKSLLTQARGFSLDLLTESK